MYFEVNMVDSNKAIKEQFRDKNIYIWNCNKGSVDTLLDFLVRGVRVAGLAVADEQYVGMNFFNIDIVSINDLDKDAIIATSSYLSVVSEEKLKGHNYFRVDEVLADFEIFGYNIKRMYQRGTYVLQLIYQVITDSYKLCVISSDDDIYQWTKECLAKYEIEIDYHIEEPIEIYTEGIDETRTVFLVNELDRHKRYQLLNALRTMGIRHKSIGSFEEFRCTEFANDFHKPDVLVGFSDDGDLQSRKYPGWLVYGEDRDDDYRIIVLGGSTSTDGYFYEESWVKKLYKKMMASGVQVTIYNGAHIDQRTSDELLRLIRDGHAIKPNLVISFDGVNDLQNGEFANLFYVPSNCEWLKSLEVNKESICYGIVGNDSNYKFWLRNHKYMKCISDVLGAKYVGILQPLNYCKVDMCLSEKIWHELEGTLDGIKAFNKEKECDEYIDMMRLFEDRLDLYIDSCHYTNVGHSIIADKVFDIIARDIVD